MFVGIRSESRAFKPFVSVRVGEIQSNSDPCQWRHIPGEINVADDVSRGIQVEQLEGWWQRGPDFLYLPESEWPHGTTDYKKEAKDVEEITSSEYRKVFAVNATTDSTEKIIDCRKFSEWRKLIRVTAYVLRFVKNLKGKCEAKGKEESPIDTRCDALSPDELNAAETYWILEAQQEIQGKYKKGDYSKLSPFVDKDGVIRVGGRVDKAIISYESKHPILLPHKHWISLLITRRMHQNGHYLGVAATTAKTRVKYWIQRVHDLTKLVKLKCVTCREFEGKTESQLMCELPTERLLPCPPEFYATSCDYFGPYSVKVGRNKTAKHYGVLFTCLNTRAVHLELAVDCSAMEFTQVLRRFFALRGQPAKMLSDNGTQLVGAERELREMIEGWNVKELQDYCAEKGVEWKFVTPAATHQNGCAEAYKLVKSCKLALKKAVGDQILTPFELYTVLQEVANLVNQRPIGRTPNDPDDGSYLMTCC